MFQLHDTIAAIATAPAGAARGIVRLSGSQVVAILDRCFRAENNLPLDHLLSAQVLTGKIQLSAAAIESMPGELYLWPDARSYTRQPAAELHVLGSPPLVAAVLRTVCDHGARLAEPGEFTLRAFLAGRLDLTQAEAVLSVIDARADQSLKLALEQLAGGLARPLHALRESLLNLLAHLEAGLDFVEEDIEFVSHATVRQELNQAKQVLAGLTSQLQSRMRHDALPDVTLVGWPNVGKSRLFNALAGAGQALVSNQPGTTRDYLATELDLEGVRCQLIDTAGFEPSTAENPIGNAAGQLGQQQAVSGTLRIVCLDSARPANEWERQTLANIDAAMELVVLTKCDLATAAGVYARAIATSAATGAGLDRLRRALRDALVAAEEQEATASATWLRSADSIQAASQALARAEQLSALGGNEELLAAEIRVALDELGKVVGAVYTDDILDRIFSRFCIGK